MNGSAQKAWGRRVSLRISPFVVALVAAFAILLTGCDNVSNQSNTIQVQASQFFTPPMVVTGWFHSVALKSDGTVWTWGAGERGQLGDGQRVMGHYVSAPVQVQNLSNITYIVAGSSHTFALRDDGTVWAWGSAGRIVNSATPIQIYMV